MKRFFSTDARVKPAHDKSRAIGAGMRSSVNAADGELSTDLVVADAGLRLGRASHRGHLLADLYFLWLSDIGLVLTLAALLSGSRLLASMGAVGVLALELAWTIDFLAGGRFISIAAYMFDAKLPRYLRGLSLFHLALPPTLLFLVYEFGYDRRALIYQTLLTWAVLIVTIGSLARAANRNAFCRHCFISASKWRSFR